MAGPAGDGRLAVFAEHADEDRGRKKRYRRSFRFSSDLDVEEMSATDERGILSVRLPKPEPTAGADIDTE